MTGREIADIIEQLSPPLGGDEGFRFGTPDAQVSGVLVCWMCTLEAIRAAVAHRCNLIVTHEELHYPYSFRQPGLENHITWPVNHARLSALAKHDITVYRAHGMLDRYCILDDFAQLLGLPDPTVRDGYVRIYEIDPLPVRDLAAQVKSATGLDHLRVTGSVDKMVHRIGLPWGGLGLSLNVSFLNGLLAHKPDCFIAGETDEYAQRFCQDAGVVMIETGHAVSEEPGLENFAKYLSERVSPVPVIFHRLAPAWQVL